MHPNYYEAEWLTRFKLKEAMERTRKGYRRMRGKRETCDKKVETRAIAPALRKSGSPC
ncbi:hypothetical protein KJ567_01865 [Candidatus Bipolaricaulota bacterium]|nr:hypothetical protein [Candidatus Bipolaricaulota bacterium]